MLSTEINQLMKSIQQDNIQKIVVGAVVEMQPRTPLLLRRTSDDFMGGCVELPSGTVEPSETFIEALNREVWEETGLTIVSIERIIDTFDYFSGSGKKTRQVNFKVSVANEAVKLSAEHDCFYICSIDEEAYQRLNMTPETRQTIAKAFS